MTALLAPAPETTSKLTPADRKLFRGTAAEVHPWMSTEDILESINCNFRVTRHAAQVGGQPYPDCQLWLRDDSNAMLGFFGNRRQVIQPATFIEYFRAFTASSEKQISLDVVGSLDGGKTFYMGSKLSGNNAALLDANLGGQYGAGGGLGISRRGSEHYLEAADRTDFWLVITDYYGESLSPKAIILGNELVCSNGLAVRVTDSTVKLTHRLAQSYDDVALVLQRAIERSRAYGQMKDRLIETPISMDSARRALRQFFRDEDGQSSTVKHLERIYDSELIGGELATRQGNLWRLASAVTQYTSHERIGSRPEAQERTLRSQLEGSRARTNARFLEFLEDQFLPTAQLAIA
jgi:hypothetical protein